MKIENLAEIRLKLTQTGNTINLETDCYGEMKYFADIAQILKENKSENSHIIILLSTLIEIIKEKEV